jgi:XTP/dITP diphosphohydrolase
MAVGGEGKMEFVFASHNKGKAAEAAEIFALAGFVTRSAADVGYMEEVAEDGATFAENAVKKALAMRKWLDARGMRAAALADDSGLEVAALGGEPGVRSARYMGANTPQSEKNAAIIARLAGVENRAARFVCAVVCVTPDGSVKTAEGTVEGVIAFEPAGAGGFGYDPIFFLPELGCTMAQLTPARKNALSHRGRALRGLLEALRP